MEWVKLLVGLAGTALTIYSINRLLNKAGDLWDKTVEYTIGHPQEGGWLGRSIILSNQANIIPSLAIGAGAGLGVGAISAVRNRQRIIEHGREVLIDASVASLVGAGIVSSAVLTLRNMNQIKELVEQNSESLTTELVEVAEAGGLVWLSGSIINAASLPDIIGPVLGSIFDSITVVEKAVSQELWEMCGDYSHQTATTIVSRGSLFQPLEVVEEFEVHPDDIQLLVSNPQSETRIFELFKREQIRGELIDCPEWIKKLVETFPSWIAEPVTRVYGEQRTRFWEKSAPVSSIMLVTKPLLFVIKTSVGIAVGIVIMGAASWAVFGDCAYVPQIVKRINVITGQSAPIPDTTGSTGWMSFSYVADIGIFIGVATMFAKLTKSSIRTLRGI